MATLQDLNRRIKSVSNTRKITKAMEMIAAAKLRKAQQRIERLRPFADAMVELTARVAEGIRAGSSYPLLEEREVNHVAIIMFTGDRGLAGALNANVLRRSLELARQYEGEGAQVHWIGVGKKGVGSLQFRKLPLSNAYRGITDNPKYRDAEAIAAHVIQEFEAGTFDKVVMVYNNFASAMSQRVVVQDLLPLSEELLGTARKAGIQLSFDSRATDKPMLAPTNEIKTDHLLERKAEKPDGHKPDWFFEPDTDTLLRRLLPTYVEQALYRALLESTASEHGARMSAMRNASENAIEIMDALTLQRNRARQAEITQQILEVVAGAEALE